MGRVTNKNLLEEVSYIKGKIDAGEKFAKEHRAWEVTEMLSIHSKLDTQNGRIRKNENSVSWFKGILFGLTGFVGWLFKKII
tara:strand:+ start:229 stop:474 length:246 start_codon:yes stop_codon:yes gene_type:complete